MLMLSNLISRIDAAITELEEVRALLFNLDEEQADVTWVDDMRYVMRGGGRMDLSTIYERVKERRREFDRTWPRYAESGIRCQLQTQQHLFRSPERGVWQLRTRVE
jgi:hypothetical protein